MFTLKKKYKLIYGLIAYLAGAGFVLLSSGVMVLKVYFTAFTVCMFLFIMIKKQAIYTNTVIAFLIFLSQGINSITLYIFRDRYLPTGYNGIRDFDFSIKTFLFYYLQIVILLLCILFGSILSNVIFKKNVDNNNRSCFNNQLVKRLDDFFIKNNEKVMIGAVIIFCTISVFMFENQISVLGFTPPSLPFHIVGLLHYFRLYICNLIIFLLYIIKPRRLELLLVFIYSYVVLITSDSKLCGLGCLSLILLFEIYQRDYKKIVFIVFFMITMYYMNGYLRYDLFWDRSETTGQITYYIQISLLELVYKSFVRILEFFVKMPNSLMENIHTISNRFFGTQILVLCSQYKDLSNFDCIKYFSGASIRDLLPDLERTVCGMKKGTYVPMGFGVGFIGDMILVGHGNYLLFWGESIWITLVLTIFDHAVCGIFTNKIIREAGSASVAVLFWIQIINIKNLYLIVLSSLLLFMGLSILQKKGIMKLWKIEKDI